MLHCVASYIFVSIEYRSIVGLPGGTSHALYSEVERAAQSMGMVLVVGNGNDPDTFGTKSVFVYNSIEFPFYQAEVFHQYHDDFQSPPYGKAYNDLRIQAFEEGRIKATGCPDDPSPTKMMSSTSTPIPFLLGVFFGIAVIYRLGLFFFGIAYVSCDYFLCRREYVKADKSEFSKPKNNSSGNQLESEQIESKKYSDEKTKKESETNCMERNSKESNETIEIV